MEESQTKPGVLAQAEQCEHALVQKAAPRYRLQILQHKATYRVALAALVVLVPVLVCLFAVQFIHFVLWIAFPVTHP